METETKPLDADLAQSTGVSNPLVLLDKMVEKGIEPEALRQMMDLAERWEHNQAVKSFNSAMVACQREMPTVIRDALNRETNKKYAPLETVSFAIKPTYTKHGFSLSFSTADSPKPDHYRVVCDLMHSAGHIKTHFGDFPMDNKGPKGAPNKTDIQGAVSAMSYGQKKLTTMMFNVTVADEDRDGQSLPIGEGEIMAINVLIDEITRLHATATAAGKVIDKPFHMDKFLGVFLCKKLGELTTRNFLKAMDMLAKRVEGARLIMGGKP